MGWDGVKIWRPEARCCSVEAGCCSPIITTCSGPNPTYQPMQGTHTRIHVYTYTCIDYSIVYTCIRIYTYIQIHENCTVHTNIEYSTVHKWYFGCTRGVVWCGINRLFLTEGSSRPTAACPLCTWGLNKVLVSVWRLKCFCIDRLKCFGRKSC